MIKPQARRRGQGRTAGDASFPATMTCRPAKEESRESLWVGSAPGGRGLAGQEDALDPGRVDASLEEVAIAEDPPMQRDRGLDPLDGQLVKRPPHGRQRVVSRGTVDDQLAQ